MAKKVIVQKPMSHDEDPVTKGEFRGFKKEFQSWKEEMPTKQDLLVWKSELPSKHDLLVWKDEVVTILRQERLEDAVVLGRHLKYDDELEDHEIRITKLERK